MGEPARRTWRRWALEIAIFVAILAGIRAWQGHGTASGHAPPLDALDLDGARVSLEPRDRPVIVHFMASWCAVCSAEEPNVAALARDHDVIAIATQSGDAAEVGRWIATTDLDPRDVRIIPDPRGDLARAWGVRVFPTAFYVDRAGDIRHVEVGYTTLLGMRARSWLSGW